jgi:hypothetical protein
MPFNENHKRRLLTTFQHIDRLFAQAAANLGLVEAVIRGLKAYLEREMNGDVSVQA